LQVSVRALITHFSYSRGQFTSYNVLDAQGRLVDRYVPGLTEHQPVRRGQLIGYVGSSGNASEDAPHLHFAIARLDTDHSWWKGDPINPYPLLSK